MGVLPDRIGPLLTSRGVSGDRHAVSVLVGVRIGDPLPTLISHPENRQIDPVQVDRLTCQDEDWVFWRFDLELPNSGGSYHLGSRRFDVASVGQGALRIAYVSCNGKERLDFERPTEERDAMWRRLAKDHRNAPFGLLLAGGDQIYADAALEAHPDVQRWQTLAPDDRGEIQASPEAEAAVTAVFLDRWRRTLAAPGAAELHAEVPSLAMWDDHDIMDGWGSHPEPVQTSPIGQMVWNVAQRFYRLFHAGGQEVGAAPFGFARFYPGLTIVAPDLRSERQKRRVMGPSGWADFEQALKDAPDGRVLVMSSVPALGPRLSLLEGVHRIVPGAQKYEDDLRDQWQSRAHRQEWRRFLEVLEHRAARGPVAVVSGEIHLAARGEMRLKSGDVLHQLTASGISHPPPPRAFAKALGALAMLGESPLRGRPIRLLPLPGQRARYVAERNYLVLERRAGEWSTYWELEESGRTPNLPI